MFPQVDRVVQDRQEVLRLADLFRDSEFLNFHQLHCGHPNFVADDHPRSKAVRSVHLVLQVVLRQGIAVQSAKGKMAISDLVFYRTVRTSPWFFPIR